MHNRAVIFDLFGTLVPPVTAATYRSAVLDIAQVLRVDSQAMEEFWLMDHVFREHRMTGRGSSIENMKRACRHLGLERSQKDLELAARVHLDAHRKWLQPWHDSIETLGELRARRIQLGLISDCSIEVPELWPETDFAGLFDLELFSCLAGAIKPSNILYHTACDGLGVRAEECLYVGDSNVELEGAERVGMMTIKMAGERTERDGWAGKRVTTPGGVLGVFFAG